jgi:hypothetical protein
MAENAELHAVLNPVEQRCQVDAMQARIAVNTARPSRKRYHRHHPDQDRLTRRAVVRVRACVRTTGAPDQVFRQPARKSTG